jgi:hypothetical protein
MIKMTLEKEGGETFEYYLPEGDSMMIGIELEEILREHELISEDEVLEIVDSIEAKKLHY